MNNYPTGMSERDYEHVGERKHDEFNCLKCGEWVPNCCESEVKGVCEDCLFAFQNHPCYAHCIEREAQRREPKLPKYVINLSEIKEKMKKAKTNRMRKGEKL